MENSEQDQQDGLSRRDMLKIGGLGGLALTATGMIGSTSSSAETQGGLSTHVAPGELDEYYGFWSGGQSGEVRIMGLPSMRVLKRIPVFNFDCTYGHGVTNYTKGLLNGKKTGDTHHFHLSYKDGWYDGQYGFVNDKAQGRLARIRLDFMETDAICEIPNCQGTHGIFPSRHTLKDVYCNSEFATPIDNNGKTADDIANYVALHTCIDARKMVPKWQVAVKGNLDLCATDYDGKYSMGTCYNSEKGTNLAEMMGNDRDWLAVFNIAAIEKAVADGKTITIGDSDVPVLDGRVDDNPYVLYIPIPNSPHGVNVDPTGRYAICSGKLSPTCSVIDLQKIDSAFGGSIKPRDCVVAEPEVGLGPLHTAFDGRGNAYTSLFLDSAVVKWDIAKAVAGENPIVDKIDIHYQIGHINASNSETKRADGQWLISLNKFSKDRFLSVGPFHPENEQLIDISGDKMRIVHDSATHSEPHDAVIASPEPFKPKKRWDPADAKFEFERKLAAKHGVQLGAANQVIRDGSKVTVFMTSVAPAFGLTEIRVQQGDEVTLVLTNLDQVDDLCHGFCLSHHDINFGVAPSETVSTTFTADTAGVFWYYCPWFCHALHLEMRGRFIVS
ncbi:MAG: TAT-dependent nitrous-oxide reductase [Candidatus Latescibacteria bacterium]|jgi:nitrous-oxide reductase|nr:nitrous-oxide reductase [Gemmatimonadaceae bacterium]MDP6016035.1 TAT-dependent nitrous-oxide reductase [Candidatus Latescibacterota bacterium]MDP7448440.1 TAT-dependent nitrous-oxide reductase [Candidatus Latescibacterota bacterium]HJP30550.1 TAT-dependent nitrous-oxide reductase [Candidatus Latescibacterota bacterium]